MVRWKTVYSRYPLTLQITHPSLCTAITDNLQKPIEASDTPATWQVSLKPTGRVTLTECNKRIRPLLGALLQRSPQNHLRFFVVSLLYLLIPVMRVGRGAVKDKEGWRLTTAALSSYGGSGSSKLNCILLGWAHLRAEMLFDDLVVY